MPEISASLLEANPPPPSEHLTVSRNYFIIMPKTELVSYSGWSPKTQLNILQLTEQPHDLE